MIKKTILALTAALTLAGCASHKAVPTQEQLDKEYATLFAAYPSLNEIWQVLEKANDDYFVKPSEANKVRYIYLYDRYVKLVAEREFDVLNALATTRQLQVTWGNQGRAGAVEKQPGYINVLGGTPVYNNVPAKTSRKTVSKGTKTLSSYDRAWSRYCNYGKNLTAEDWKIIAQSDSIPAKYLKNCHPPK